MFRQRLKIFQNGTYIEYKGYKITKEDLDRVIVNPRETAERL
jgi:hypothetical protein